MSKSSKFLGNTVILSVGTIGAKLIQYLLLPYYTNILSTAEYGIVDNLQNITTLLVPIISLTISEGIFRYVLDHNYRKEEIFSNGMAVNLIGSVLLIVIAAILCLRMDNKEYELYVVLIGANVITNFMRTNCSQYVKAAGNTILYTVDSLVMTFAVVMLNIIFLSVFDMGITGYILGYILGNIISFLFLFVSGKLYRVFSLRCLSSNIIKMLIVFCIPLIPNTICWWVSNCSDRFMITYFMGVSENGLYAIAYKIPTILTIFVGIIIQAWQILANQSSEDKKIAFYYTKMYGYLDTIIVSVGAVTVLFSRFLIDIMAAPAYLDAWRYVPFLVFAICFYSKAQLLGTAYTTFHRTTMAFITNLIAAVVNIIGNYILIRLCGVLGAAIATAVSYIVLCYARKYNTKKYVAIVYDNFREAGSGLILLIEVAVITLFPQYFYLSIICAAAVLAVNIKVIKELLFRILGLVRGKLHG